MTPCVSGLTTLSLPFDEDVRAFSNAACPAMEVWLTKLDTFIDGHSVEAAAELVQENELTLAVAAGQGGILVSQAEQRRESFALFAKRLAYCESLRIPTVVVIADFETAHPVEVARAVVSLKQAAAMARDHGVRIAVEFQGKRPFCNNLDTAAEMVGEIAEPNLGLCLDLYHFYVGPSKFDDLRTVSPANLFHVQMCDIAGVPRELATDADRILPGDGDFNLNPIVALLRQCNYPGYVSVELMNPDLQRLPGAQVVEVSLTALRRALMA